MFSMFQKLLGLKSREEVMPPFILEKPVVKKSVGETKRGVYEQIAGLLYGDGIFSSYSGYDTYPRLKKSLQRINEAIEANKENLVSNERELKALKEKVLEYKDERNLTFMTYDICKLISINRYEDPSILSNMTIRRIMNYWYGFY